MTQINKDITEKILASYNDVFSDIVNGLLFEGKPVVDPDMLSDVTPYSLYKTDGKVHEQERDVCKILNADGDIKNEIRLAFIGFEHQTQYDKDMPLRVIGYDGAAYRAELSSKARYPVITIVLYFGSTHWNSNKTLHEAVGVPDSLRPYVNDYKMNLFEIAFMSDEEIQRFHSDFRIIADLMAHKRADPGYISKDRTEFVHTDEIVKLMSLLTGDDRYVDALNSEGGKPKNMCEMLDRVEAKGLAKGEDKFASLVDRLFSAGRIDDIKKATNDPIYRKQLYKEFGIGDSMISKLLLIS